MMDDDSLYRVRRKILRCVSRIQEVAFELRAIADRELIPSPPEQQEETTRGIRLISYQDHLVGMLGLIRYHLLEVGSIVETHGIGLTPKTFRIRVHSSLEILDSLQKEVKRHHAPDKLRWVKEWDKKH
jgi:hypothetical protein